MVGAYGSPSHPGSTGFATCTGSSRVEENNLFQQYLDWVWFRYIGSPDPHAPTLAYARQCMDLTGRDRGVCPDVGAPSTTS